jgi:hypothetical protein
LVKIVLGDQSVKSKVIQQKKYFLEESKRLIYVMFYSNYFYDYHNKIINISVIDKVCVPLQNKMPGQLAQVQTV